MTSFKSNTLTFDKLWNFELSHTRYIWSECSLTILFFVASSIVGVVTPNFSSIPLTPKNDLLKYRFFNNSSVNGPVKDEVTGLNFPPITKILATTFWLTEKISVFVV